MNQYVYLAGPLTHPSPMSNTREAIRVADILLDLGFTPYVPHLTVLWDIVSPRPYEAWMELDLAWLLKCEAVVRIPGDSPGADREVAFAKKAGIPVYVWPEVPVRAV